MCKHERTIKLFGDVKFCPKCGLTVLPNGLFYIDKKLKERAVKKKREK